METHAMKLEARSDVYVNEEIVSSGEEQDLGQFGYKPELKVYLCTISQLRQTLLTQTRGGLACGA